MSYFLIHRTNNRFLYTNFNSILNFFFHFEIGRLGEREDFSIISIIKLFLIDPNDVKIQRLRNTNKNNYRLIRIYQFSSGRGYLKIT